MSDRKIIRLVDYLTLLASLRTKTIRDIADYERTLWISDIPHEEGCFTQAWGRGEEFDPDLVEKFIQILDLEDSE